MNRFLAILAFAVFTAFLYILVRKVGTLDLWIVVGLTAALAGYDFVTSSKNKS